MGLHNNAKDLHRNLVDTLCDHDLMRRARDPFSAEDLVLVCEVCDDVEGHKSECPVGQVLHAIEHVARTLERFYLAPFSLSSVQPLLDLTVELNPKLQRKIAGAPVMSANAKEERRAYQAEQTLPQSASRAHDRGAAIDLVTEQALKLVDEAVMCSTLKPLQPAWRRELELRLRFLLADGFYGSMAAVEFPEVRTK